VLRLFVLLLVAVMPATLSAQELGGASQLDPPAGPTEVGRTPTEPGSVPAVPDIRYPVPPPGGPAAAPRAASVRIPSRITTRLRALDAHLSALGARGGGNVVNAILSLVTGGVTITLGALTPDEGLAAYLYIYGGVSATRGLLDLFLRPNASGQAVRYSMMPMTTREEVRERLRFGEDALSGVAERALIARVLDGSLNLASGVAVVPVVLARDNFAFDEALDYFVLIGAAVSVVSGIVTLVSSSAEEQRWGAYQQLRERLREERARELGEAAAAEEDDLALLEGGPRLSVAASPVGFRLAF
jgi:hypothetical protein